MKVLEILNSYPAETFIKEHALSIVSNNKEVELIWAFTQTKYIGRKRAWDFNNIKSYAFPNYYRFPKFLKLIFTLLYIGNKKNKVQKPQDYFIKILKPDIVHFHFASIAVKYFKICLKNNIPFTFSVRGSDIQVAPLSVPDYIEKLCTAAKHAKTIHCVSNQLKTELHTYIGNNDKTFVIRTAISNDWTLIKREPINGLFVAVGRLHWRKGYPDLINAIYLIVRKGIKIQLLIIGDGPQKFELEFMIRNLDLTDHVTLLGYKSHKEIKEIFSKASGLILSSIAEGFPNVVAEAMMAGVPVIVSDCCGINEIIIDGWSGYVYKNGNIENLSNKILFFINKKSHDGIIKNAKKIAEQTFSYEQHSKQFIQLWNK